MTWLLGLQNLDQGVTINDTIVSILLYADDVDILSEKHDMSKMLNLISLWCKEWGMKGKMTK